MSHVPLVILLLSALMLMINVTVIQLNAYTRICEDHTTVDIVRNVIALGRETYPVFYKVEKDATSFDKTENFSAYLELAKNFISTAKEHNSTCHPTVESPKCKEYQKPIDCLEVLESGYNVSGIYRIWPKNRILSSKSLSVYCDMDTENGGWTVIQRRGNFPEQENFYRNWTDYKVGFGYLKKEFWLGNDNIFTLTNQDRYAVRFDLEDVKGTKRFAVYRSFWIKDEDSFYHLHIANYSGNAGDSMAYHNDHGFLTKDFGIQANDENCAVLRNAGWWYDYCTESNLNGVYQPGVVDRKGITWYSFKNEESLASVEIKLKRILV